MNKVECVLNELKSLSNPVKAAQASGFFKTGPGEYGEGDKFLGVSVPNQRLVAKKFHKDFTLDNCAVLIRNEYHEARLTALFIMVLIYQKNKNEDFRKELVDLYLNNTAFINNWDLVDSSAHLILGAFFENKDKLALIKMAKEGTLWERRMAMLATYYYIRKNNFQDALLIAEILLHDKHDLIHKAVGWMLREIGNRNLEVETSFLNAYYKSMPRTSLRYAIEKFPLEMRRFYMR